MVNEERMESLLNDGEAGSEDSQLPLSGGVQIDLNGRDLTPLQASGLLSLNQVSALYAHRQRFGRLLAPEELQVIEGFDADLVRRVRAYVFCSEPGVDQVYRLSHLLATAKQELLLRHRRVLQDKEGFNGDGRYPFYYGDANQMFLRYRFHAGQLLSAGITMEKDAGEKWLDRDNGGRVDFFSWHVFLRPRRLIRTMVIGDYQLQYGQGLVVWKGLSLGKGADIASACRLPAGITPYSSAAESGFFRGIALALGQKAWQTDLWLAYNRLDASLFSPDTVPGRPMAGSIIETGLHRTQTESVRRAALGSLVAGVHLQWKNDRLLLESTTLFQQLEHPLWPGNDVYERFDATGRSFFHTGIAFRYLYNNATIYGETAIGKEGSPAYCAGLVMIPHPQWSLNIHFRHFPASFQSLQADALRENSRTRNEIGYLSGISWQPSKVIRLFAGYDRYDFPWLRYTTTSPAGGSEWQFQCTYSPTRTTSCYLRVKSEGRPLDVTGERIAVPVRSEKTNVRFNLEVTCSRVWELQTRMEWTCRRLQDQHGRGVLFFQELRYKPPGKPFSFALRMALFNTDSYEERVYAYEQDMAGSFSLPAMAGAGSRTYFLMRYRLTGELDFWIRYSVSAPVSQAGNRSAYVFGRRDEFKTQIRWKF